MAKQRGWERRDPEASQEAQKYAHPVPSRAFLLQYLEEQGVPFGGNGDGPRPLPIPRDFRPELVDPAGEFIEPDFPPEDLPLDDPGFEPPGFEDMPIDEGPEPY